MDQSLTVLNLPVLARFWFLWAATGRLALLKSWQKQCQATYPRDIEEEWKRYWEWPEEIAPNHTDEGIHLPVKVHEGAKVSLLPDKAGSYGCCRDTSLRCISCINLNTSLELCSLFGGESNFFHISWDSKQHCNKNKGGKTVFEREWFCQTDSKRVEINSQTNQPGRAYCFSGDSVIKL